MKSSEANNISHMYYNTGPQKKYFVMVIWPNINFLYKFDKPITNMSAISLHHVRIFFMDDWNIYHFHQNSRDAGCIKFNIAETMSEI